MNGELLIGDVFRNAARAVPDRMAVALGDVTLTFAQLEHQANRVARALDRLGVRRGDRVAAWSATSIEKVVLFAALAKAGGVFAPVNPALSPDEAAAVFETIRPSLLLVDADRETPAQRLAAAADFSLVRSDGPPAGTSGLRSLPVLAAAAEPDGEPAPGGLSERDPHVIFLTSGSTGRPKAAIVSHRVNFLRSHPGSQLEPRGVMVCPYPLFHMGAWTIALQQWQARDGVVFVDTADAVTICDAVERHRAARLNCVPAVWRRILDHLTSPEGKERDLSSIRYADSGTSATPLPLLEAIEAALPGAVIRVFYGSTEAGSVAALEHADIRRKPGSCGPPAPSTEVRVDASGELWVRGPLLFDGYFADPGATADAVVDGWYRTGDLAGIDADGYLTILGRARELIRTGGETVAPLEVEAVLATHADLEDVAVVGLPDPDWGEVVTAVIVVAPGAAAPPIDNLRRHCEGRLAPFKHPRRAFTVDSIPRTASTGQVQRRLLVEQLG